MPKLWDIALGEAEHPDLSADTLTRHALDLLPVFLARRDPSAFAIFSPAVERSCDHQDRRELARELLKLVRWIQGEDSINKELAAADKRDDFSRRHVTVPDERFAAVWNRPGMETLKPRDRAERLRNDLGSTSVETALRRVRRMVERGWDMAGYERGPNGRAKRTR